MRVVDGFGMPVRLVARRMAPMRKGSAVTERPAVVPVEQWEDGDFHCAFGKAGRWPVVTLTSDALPLPFHILVKNRRDARKQAAEAVKAFQAGKAPARGVFR